MVRIKSNSNFATSGETEMNYKVEFKNFKVGERDFGDEVGEHDFEDALGRDI